MLREGGAGVVNGGGSRSEVKSTLVHCASVDFTSDVPGAGRPLLFPRRPPAPGTLPQHGLLGSLFRSLKKKPLVLIYMLKFFQR